MSYPLFRNFPLRSNHALQYSFSSVRFQTVICFILSKYIGINTADCNGADGSGVDYFSLVDETVAFPISSTSQTVDIYIKNDTGNVDFMDETFCVNFDTTCRRGEVSDTLGSVTVTILNDDSMYVFYLRLNTSISLRKSLSVSLSFYKTLENIPRVRCESIVHTLKLFFLLQLYTIFVMELPPLPLSRMKKKYQLIFVAKEKSTHPDVLVR